MYSHVGRCIVFIEDEVVKERFQDPVALPSVWHSLVICAPPRVASILLGFLAEQLHQALILAVYLCL